MKLKNWLIAGGIIAALAASAVHKKLNYCQNHIEDVMKKYVMASPQERGEMYGEFGECLKVPDTIEEFLQELEDKGYVCTDGFFGKITEPIRTITDNGKEYKVIMYNSIADRRNITATHSVNRILLDKKFIDGEVSDIVQWGESNTPNNDISAKLKLQFYNSQKGENNKEARSNIYNSIVENYTQHEMEHIRNGDRESTVNAEIKADLKSLIKAPSYNTFIDLDSFEAEGSPIYSETAKRIFDEFEKHGVPKEKIPETSLEELSRVAGEIYREL